MTLILDNALHPARVGRTAQPVMTIEPCPYCGAAGPWTVDAEGDVSCVLCGRLALLYHVVGRRLYKYVEVPDPVPQTHVVLHS